MSCLKQLEDVDWQADMGRVPKGGSTNNERFVQWSGFIEGDIKISC